MSSVAPPLDLQPNVIEQLLEETRARESLLTQMIQQFERKFGMSLGALEEKLARGEYPEHPAWEESIEWRNAVEQLARVETTRSILTWLNNWLAQSPSS